MRSKDEISQEITEAEKRLADLRLEHASAISEERRAVAGGETFTCPIGPGESSPFKAPFNGLECFWEKQGNDRVCSYCGSWHPEEFAAWCEGIVAGQVEAFYVVDIGDTYKSVHTVIDVADSRVKIYVHRKGIKNAGDGAIKVKTAHLTPGQLALANETMRFCRDKAKDEAVRRGWSAT